MIDKKTSKKIDNIVSEMRLAIYKSALNITEEIHREIEDEDQLWIHAKLYRDYYRNNKYLMDKYTDAKLYYLPSAAKQTRDDIDQMEMLSNEDIDRIIDMCAGVDLDKAYETITQMTRDLLET